MTSVIPRRFLGYLWIVILFSILLGVRKPFSLGGLWMLGAGVWSIVWGAPISHIRLKSAGHLSPWPLAVVIAFVVGVIIFLFVVPLLCGVDS